MTDAPGKPGRFSSQLSNSFCNQRCSRGGAATVKKEVGVYARVNWGPDEARGDNGLARYFVAHPDYREVREGRKRYVIGRKGAGKTAVLERIRLDAAATPMVFCRSLSLRQFPLALVRQLRDKSMRDKSQYVPVWTFLLATEFARMVLEDQASGPPDVIAGIREFVSQNFPDDSFGMAQTLSRLGERNAKVQVLPNWMTLGTKTGTTITSEVHYQKATESLLTQLSLVRSESKYFLLIDNLDEGYAASDANINLLLLALLRAVEDTALALNKQQSVFRPVAVLRSDIFDRLEDSDLNKLDDYVMRLHWRSDVHDGTSLRSIVDARIRASLKGHSSWDDIAMDDDPDLPRRVRSLWQYIANRTLERPRDILKFLKISQKHVSGLRLSYSSVRAAEVEYSGWLYRETRDELHAHLSVWKEALDCITRIGSGLFTADALRQMLQQDRAVAKWMHDNASSVDDVIGLLFDFSIVGNLSEEGRWVFSYKDRDLPWTPDRDLIVHYGFHRKLRLRNRG